MAPKYRCNPGFTITPSFVLNEEDRIKIADAVTLASASESLVKTWNGNNLRLSLNQSLATNTAYVLSMSAVNDIKGINVVPFNALDFTTVGGLGFTVTPDDDNIYAAVSPKYHCRPAFTITPDFTLSDDDRVKIQNVVALSDAASITTKVWDGNNLKISLTENLATNTAYTLSMAAVNDIEGVSIIAFEPVEFTTIEALTFTVTPDDDNLFDVQNSLSHCKPGFTITPSFALNDADKAKILDSVGVSDVASSTLVRNWNNEGNLHVGFNTKLASGTDYSLNMAAVNDIKGVEVTPFDAQAFRTMNAINITLDSEDSNIIDVPNNLYHCRPQFTITPGYDADDSAKEIIASAVTVIGADENNITKTWVNGNLVVGFASNLTTNTDYTVSLGDIESSIDRLAFKVFEPLTFTTTDDSYIALVPDDGNVFISTPSELYHCRPVFTITPSVALGNSDRATIAGAIHVSNVLDEDLTKDWDASGSLILGFSQNLTHNTEYTVSINPIGEIAGVNLVLFQPFTFRTVPALNLNLASMASNTFVTTPSELYHCRPGFTMTPSLALGAEDRAKIAAAIRVTNVNDSNITREWDNSGNLLIGFNQNLNVNTNYTVSLAAVNDITGITVNPFTPFAFTTMGAVTFTVTPDAGNVYAAAAPLYRCNPAFTITPNYTLSDANKTTIANAVSVTGSAVTSKAWDGNNLRVTFSSALTPDSDYTLTMAAVNSITGVSVTQFASQNFTTVPTLTFTLDSPDSNVFVSSPSELYHCRPVFTLIPSFNLNDEDKTVIKNAVTISSGNNLMTKNWNGNNLEIAFSNNLAASTEYTISMNVPSISGVSVTSMTSKSFTTIGGLNIAIASDSGDVFVIENGVGLYQTLPTFTVTSNMALSEEDQTKIKNAISVSNIDDPYKVTKSWANATTLNISFTENLAHNTNYTISMADVDDISGVSVGGFSPLTFKTMNALTFTAADVDGNLFVTNPSVLYQCRPSFTVTPNYTLNEENRTKIANAVTVSNANNITKTWNNNILTVSFSSDLALSSAHTLSMGAVNDITGVSVTPFANKSFTTIGAITFTATPDDSNVYTAMNPKYHCKPAFTITPNYSLAALSEASRTALLDAVTISNSSGVTKAWDGNNIRVTCSTNLAANAHSLSMSEVDFTGITVTPFANLDFSVLDTLTFTVTPDAGNVYTALSPKYNCRPSYTITTSFTLNEEDKTKIKNAISVSNTESIIHKEWQGNSLVITFSENLTSNTAYTLSMESVSGMPNVNITNFSNQTFTTIPQLTFNITSANTNVFYDGKYHCNPTFTITPNFAIDSSYNSAIEGAVSVSGVSPSNVSKTWNGNNLLLGFNNYIATSTDYTISMSAINNLTGVNVTSLSNFDFSTIPDLIVSLATSTTTLVKKANSSNNVLDVNGKNFCYCSGSSFTISTNMTLNQTNKDKIFGAVSLTGINSSLVNKGWNEEKIAIGFNDTLPASTSYSIQMSAINDINGVTVKPFSTFTTTSFYHLGKGTEDNPFTIYTPAQLACLDLYPSEAYYYKQMEDLDLSSYANWKPIGSGTINLAFRGKYDGNYKTISNAVINHSGEDYVGLFANTIYSVFSNLNIENIEAHGHNKVGALAGSSDYSNTFTNITGDYLIATGNDSVGGVWGSTGGTSISGSEFNHIEVNATNIWIGNIIGLSSGGTITDCSVLNSSVTGRCYVGGFIGEVINNGVFTNVVCDNVTVTSTGSTSGDTGLGGFCGYCINSEKTNCSVINSHVLGAGLANNCGGFVGELGNGYKDISRNCVVRNTEITSKDTVGGFVGKYYVSEDSSNIISECLVENSSVSGGNYAGGFIGGNENSNGSGIQLSQVINTSISSSGHYVGGFGGQINVPTEKCCVIGSNVSSSAQIGGFVGMTLNGSFNKCFVKDTTVLGHQFYIAGFAGNTNSLDAIIDSCYITGCDISSEVDLGFGNTTDYSISGFVASNSGTISNCYSYNSTVTGKIDYGAFVGIDGDNGEQTIIRDCFVSQDHDIFVSYSGTTSVPISCYYNVGDLAAFKAQTWSDGKTIEGGSTAWSNFNTTSFPPQLTELPEP